MPCGTADQLIEGFAREATMTNSTKYDETKAKLKHWDEDTCWSKSTRGQHLSKIQMKSRGDQLVYLAHTTDVYRLDGGFGSV